MNKPLTATMVACIEDAQTGGGELVRYQGGFWAPRGTPPLSLRVVGYGGSTIQALVGRGEGAYIEWKEGRSGQFPIGFKLTSALVADFFG